MPVNAVGGYAMPKLKENISLARFSNYKIGGPARFFFEPKNEDEVRWALNEARAKKLPVFILGGGTNILIDDRGVKGLVLRLDIRTLEANSTMITVGAGVPMADILKFSIKKSLSGLEWAGGLPGTVGGAVRGNAGCFGGEIKDSVVSVRSLDMRTAKLIERSAKQCAFGYRASVFKKKNGREIILDAMLHLKKGNGKKIAASIKEKIDYRKKNHPLNYPNIGSIFKNVPLSAVHKYGSAGYKTALSEKSLTFRGSTFSVKTDPSPVISAAKLISESGLRGVRYGGAMFSEKHPNFIVNVKSAKSSDIKKLIALAKVRVRRRFGIILVEEVQIL